MAEEGSKTESATPRQRQQARERGQVARSVELVSAVLLSCGFIGLLALRNHTQQGFSDYFAATAGSADSIDLSPATLPAFIQTQVTAVLKLVAPYLLLTLAAALLMNYLQVGIMFTTQALQPDLNKINPLKGFSRLFSMRAIVELGKSILKLLLVGVVAFSILHSAAPALIGSIGMDPVDASLLASGIGLRIGLFSCALLLILAILDYIYQRHEFEKGIRMTKQEVKQEYKNQEGDPQIKRRIREMGRKIAMSRMFEKLAQADAVITNPTHYAVALSYDLEWPSPKVVAKGKDYLALRIIRYAEEHGIAVYQQPELARALYKVEDDAFIPPALFKTVAKILAQLSRHDARLRAKLAGLRPSGSRV